MKLKPARLENSDVILLAHDPATCAGPVCPLHNRTDHHMRTWVQHWRDDRSIMERICPTHGVGHPDPDHMSVYERRHGVDTASYEGIHGCCGCCRNPAPQLLKETRMANENAWQDLVEALQILARHPSNDVSPTHCEHDKLTVMADPARFTDDEITYLETLGFLAGNPGSEDESTFYSYRFGSA